MPRYYRPLTAVDVLFSNFLDSYGTAKHLLVERPSPPHILSTLVALAFFLVGPVFWVQMQANYPAREPEFNSAVILTLLATAGLFVLATTVLCKLLGIGASLLKILAASVYSLSPWVPITVGVHFASLLIDGRPAVIEYYALGTTQENDILVWLIPYVFMIGCAYTFVVFLNCLRVLGNGTVLTSFYITSASVFILCGSYFGAMTITDSVLPGYGHQVNAFLVSLTGPSEPEEE